MTYVDPLFRCMTSKHFHHSEACHLVADTVEEFHVFAQNLGLRRDWFQDGLVPHYDLSKRMRYKAIAAGAKSVGRKQFAKMMIRRCGRTI